LEDVTHYLYFDFLLEIAKIDQATHRVGWTDERMTIAELKLDTLKGRMSMVPAGYALAVEFAEKFRGYEVHAAIERIAKMYVFREASDLMQEVVRGGEFTKQSLQVKKRSRGREFVCDVLICSGLHESLQWGFRLIFFRAKLCCSRRHMAISSNRKVCLEDIRRN
jgi:hypothetical protein